MTPLQQVAAGLLLIALDSTTAWDVLPDPVGWLLVIPALRHLPDGVRRAPRAAALVAAAASVLAWPPAGRALVTDLDEPSLSWAVLFLPDLAFAILLCRALAGLARAAGDGAARGEGGRDSPRQAAGLTTLMVLLAVGAFAPVPFLAVGEPIPGDFEVLTQLCWLVLLVLLLLWHRRPWAPARGQQQGRSPRGERP